MLDRGETLRKLAMHGAHYSGLASLARPFIGSVGAILMLHRTTASPERPDSFNQHLNIDPAFLDRLIAVMKGDGYQFVSMDEAVARLRGRRGEGRFVAITADDGFRDNLVEALPVFERHGTPFTVYVAPGLVDGSAWLWWEVVDELVAKRESVALPGVAGGEQLGCATQAEKCAAFGRLVRYLTSDTPEQDLHSAVAKLARVNGINPNGPNRLIMNWDELRELSRHPLATIGAHTVSHCNLRRLPEDIARREMSDSATILEQKLGSRPRHFAYPYGYPAAVGSREVALAAEAGFDSAVTTRHGILRSEHADHLTALPRISINGRYQSIAHTRTMLSGFTTPLANSGKRLVTV